MNGGDGGGDHDRPEPTTGSWIPAVLAGLLVVLYVVGFRWTATRLYLLNFTPEGPNATAVLLVLFVTGWVVGLAALLAAGSRALYGGGTLAAAVGAGLGLVGNPFVSGIGGVVTMVGATAALAGLVVRDRERVALGAAGGLLVHLGADVWVATAPPYATTPGRAILGAVALATVATAWVGLSRSELPAPDWSGVPASAGPLAAFLFAEALWLGAPHAIARWFLGPYVPAVVAAVLGVVAGVALVALRPVPAGRRLGGWAGAFVLSTAGLVLVETDAAVLLAAPAQAAAVVLLAAGSARIAPRSGVRVAAEVVVVQFLGVLLVFLFVSALNWAYMPGPLPATRGLDPAFLLAILWLLPASVVATNLQPGERDPRPVDVSRRGVAATVALGAAGLVGLAAPLVRGVGGEAVGDGGREEGRGPPTGDRDPPTDGYRLATYNVHQYLDGTDAGRYNLEPVAAVIERTAPDVVGLQESEGTRITSGTVDGIRWLVDRLDYHAVYGVPTSAGSYGVALLARWPIEDARAFELPVGRSVVRPTLVATVRTPDGPLPTLVTHFEVDKPEDRHPEASERVLRAVDDEEVAALLGDFNFTPDAGAYDRLDASLTDAWAAASDGEGGDTVPADDPRDRIDYVWLKGDWTVRSARTVGDETASDHRGVVATASPPDEFDTGE